MPMVMRSIVKISFKAHKKSITHKTDADGEAVDGAVVEQEARWVGLLWKQNKEPEPW